MKKLGSYSRSSLIWKDEKNQGNLNFSVWELFPKIRRARKLFPENSGRARRENRGFRKLLSILKEVFHEKNRN